MCVVRDLQRFVVLATPDGLELYELAAYVAAMTARGALVGVARLAWDRPRGAREVLARVHDIARAGFDWEVHAADARPGGGWGGGAAAAGGGADAELAGRLRQRVLARAAAAIEALRPQSMLELRRSFMAVDADGSGAYVAAAVVCVCVWYWGAGVHRVFVWRAVAGHRITVHSLAQNRCG